MHVRNYSSAKTLSMVAAVISSLLLLYIAFMLVNNMMLMLHPEKWTAYFNNRKGTILNLDDPVLFPRYLHFVTASIAVAGLFSAIIWYYRMKKGREGAQEKIENGLKIFAIATMIQIIVGFWFFIAIPSKIRMYFMGDTILYTLVLLAGIILAIASLMTAFLKKLIPTVALLLRTVLVMVVNRAFIRAAYTEEFFSLSSLEVAPQYSVLVLFFLVFVVGIFIVRYILNAAWIVTEGRDAR